jgi:hypothetical protein
MNADEQEVHDFLKQFPGTFVSPTEVSKKAGMRRRYLADRNWARPILRRMELDGIVEVNVTGDYRLKNYAAPPPSFLAALHKPGVELGDTEIISLSDVQESVPKQDTAAA